MSNTSKLRGKLRTSILKDMRRYLNVVGPVMVTYIQNKLDVPVVGHGQGAIRSSPGEYPRKETTSLQESIDYKVENRGGRVILIFGSLNDTRRNGKQANPTLYARYLTRKNGRFGRIMARSAYFEALKTGALRKGLSRKRVPHRSSLITSKSFTPGSGVGSGAHIKPVESDFGT